MESTSAPLNRSNGSDTDGFLSNASWATPSSSSVRTVLAGSTFQKIYMAVGVFGLFSNIFVVLVIVLHRPMHKNLTNIYIANQSAMDALVAFFLFFTMYFQQDPDKILTKGNVADEMLCRLWYAKMPLWGMLVSSTYGIVMLTVERYLAVVYPIFHKTKISRNKAVCVASLTAIWIFGPLFNTAYMIPLGAVTEEHACNLYGYWPNVLTSQITGIFFTVVQYLFPLSVFIFCYSRMAWVLHRRVKGAPDLGGHHKRNETMARARSNVFKTMALVALFFVLCWTMNQVYFLLFNLGFNVDFTTDFYNSTVALVFINCCTNPIIYCIKYESFQKGILHIFLGSRVHPTNDSLPNAAEPCETLIH